jgi:signal transduction histidine kinase
VIAPTRRVVVRKLRDENARLASARASLATIARQTMRPSGSALDRLFQVPHDLAAALRIIPSIAQHTATLHEMARTLTRISGDTEALPPLSTDMARVAEATSILGGMDDSLEDIEKAMPVLVEVQRHLDQLPQTMGRLDDGIDRLSTLMEQMLPSLDGLSASVEELRVEVGPVSRLARRLPGQRRSAQQRS